MPARIPRLRASGTWTTAPAPRHALFPWNKHGRTRTQVWAFLVVARQRVEAIEPDPVRRAMALDLIAELIRMLDRKPPDILGP